MSKTNNKHQTESPEYGLDSRYDSKKEQESEATILMEARLKKMKNLTKEQIISAKLMQLKLRMEEFIRQPVFDENNYFSEFLKTYIDILYQKRSGFANDINITPIKLSQIVNGHRQPSDEFMMKLMIHSEKVFENICEFHKKYWYQVYFNEKIIDTISSQEKWRPEIEKHIRFSESFI